MLQTGVGARVLFKDPTGYIPVVTVCPFTHPLALKVYIYVTFVSVVLLLLNTWNTGLIVPVIGAVVVMPVTGGLLHENVVPTVALVARYENVVPEQIFGVVVRLLNTGIGFTFNVTVKVFGLVQPLAATV